MRARDLESKEQLPASICNIVKSVLDTQHALNDDDGGQQRELFDRFYVEHRIMFYMRNPIQPRGLLIVSFCDY